MRECMQKFLIPRKIVCRKQGFRLAQPGSRAASTASSGKCVPIPPHTSVHHRGWTLVHEDPINFISTCHTFLHARSVRRGGGCFKGVEVCSETGGNNKEGGSGKDRPRLANRRIPCILHECLHRKKKMQLQMLSQPFQGSTECRSEWVVVGFVPCGDQHCHSLC